MDDGSQNGQKKLVLLVHGIRTAARWQTKIVPQIKDDNTQVETIGYGYFNVFEFLSPIFTRRAARAQIQWRIERAIDENPGRELIIIAHSFGTDCLVHILEAKPGIRPSKVIFCGSVVNADFRWDRLRQQFKFLNDCGTMDVWPCFARSITWGYGASGTFGFKTPGLIDRFHRIRHSDYFKEGFAKKFWMPFIQNGEIFPSDDLLAMEDPAWYSAFLAMRLLWLPWLGWFAGLVVLIMVLSLSPPQRKPAVVAILPSDSFGPNCREGFVSAMAQHPEIASVVLDGTTLAQMKACRIETIESGLKDAFSTFRVVGVVGPPISECAYPVAAVIADIDPQIPVILTSAVSGNEQMWGLLRKRIPLYRVGSDISQRAKEVQDLLRTLLSNKKKVVFLIEGQAEDGPRSFGLRFFDELETAMNFFSHISPSEYERIVFPGRQVETQFDRLEQVLSDENATVFLLGVDFEMKAVVEHFYNKAGSFIPRARLVGWMNAHMLDNLYKTGAYHSNLILDISDFSRANARNFPNVAWQDDFTKRDAMNYYDSTLVVLEAWDKWAKNAPNGAFGNRNGDMQKISGEISRMNSTGIGGAIRFDSTGQNTRSLVFLKYLYETESWVETNDIQSIVFTK